MWHINLLPEPTSENKRQIHDHVETERRRKGELGKKGIGKRKKGWTGKGKRSEEEGKIYGDAGETRGETTMVMIEGGRLRRKTWKKNYRY